MSFVAFVLGGVLLGGIGFASYHFYYNIHLPSKRYKEFLWENLKYSDYHTAMNMNEETGTNVGMLGLFLFHKLPRGKLLEAFDILEQKKSDDNSKNSMEKLLEDLGLSPAQRNERRKKHDK